MIPRVGDVSQPQMSACGDFMEPGTAQAPDIHLGQFLESGTCPSTRCPQVVIPRLRDTSHPPTSAQQSLGPWPSCTCRYQCMVIPRARNVSEPQTPMHGQSAELGTSPSPGCLRTVILEPRKSLSQTVQGKWCYLGARCPVAWQLPGATLCPLHTPFLAVPAFRPGPVW